MSDIKTKIIDKLKDDSPEVQIDVEVIDPQLPRYGWDNPRYNNLEEPVRGVIASYQNANRWLDTIKEQLLIDLGCPYFSHIVHEFAHKMPGRFDKFGDMLHTEHLSVPYPSTDEWTAPTKDIPMTIDFIFDILEDIMTALYSFKESAEEAKLFHMSMACDELIAEIVDDRAFFIQALHLYNTNPHQICQWDKMIYEYYKSRGELI